MSAFTPDKQESVAQEPQALADADPEQKSDPVTDSSSDKEENA